MSTLRVDNLQGQTAGTNRYVVQVVQGTLTETGQGFQQVLSQPLD